MRKCVKLDSLMNTVDVFILNASLIKDNYDFVLSFVDKNRKEKALKYVHENDRYLSLGAGYLLKKYLPKGEIKENENGKPYLDNGPYFNISHSKEYVVLAISNTRALGVDIEYIDSNRVDAVEYVLTKEEKDIVDPKTLFMIWSNKESLIKCNSNGLKDIKDVSGLPLEGVRKVNDECYYTRSTIYDNYALSVTLKGKEPFEINKINIVYLENKRRKSII